METIEKQTIQETETVSKGILFCRKLMASRQQMQKEAEQDMKDPRIQAIVWKQIEHLKMKQREPYRFDFVGGKDSAYTFLQLNEGQLE